MGSGAMASRDGLARVTYLPGVVPGVLPGVVPQGQPPEPELPTMDSVFGVHDSPDEIAGESAGESTSELADDEAAEEAIEDQQRRAEKVSMQSLTRRGMSRWELGKALLGKDLDEGVVEAELDRLEGVGLIDDAALAETLVRTQHERKGLGRSALTAELRRRHIEQHHIDEAMAQVDDDGEQSRATELAVKRAPQLHALDLETAKRRLSGFLMRKGYSGTVVRAAVDEALSSHAGGKRSSGVRFR